MVYIKESQVSIARFILKHNKILDFFYAVFLKFFCSFLKNRQGDKTRRIFPTEILVIRILFSVSIRGNILCKYICPHGMDNGEIRRYPYG